MLLKAIMAPIMIINIIIWLIILEEVKIKWKWAIIVLVEIRFTLVIINCKNRAENSIINRWGGGKKEYMVSCNLINWFLMFQLPKEVTIFTKKLAVLLNQGLFRDKLMLILELKSTKIKESYIICRAKNKKTWISCFITSMTSIMFLKVQTEEDPQQEEVEPMAEDICLIMVVLKLKVACELKITFTNLRI